MEGGGCSNDGTVPGANPHDGPASTGAILPLARRLPGQSLAEDRVATKRRSQDQPFLRHTPPLVLLAEGQAFWSTSGDRPDLGIKWQRSRVWLYLAQTGSDVR